jgi:outer membrane protein OmpA-like peptidoglycan-associated protein
MRKYSKRLKNRTKRAAEEAILQKTEQKVYKETSKGMDTILGNDGKSNKRKSKKKNKSKENKSKENKTKGNISKGNSNNENKNHIAISHKDFVPGNKVTYTDTFKNDAIGDFPVTWNTNSSGEVITFNNEEKRWLQLDLGEFTPDGITQIPENCTLEFDLTVSDNFDWYSDGITLNIIAVKDRRKDFMQWSRFGAGTNGVRLRLKPKNFEYKGETSVQTYLDNTKIIDKLKNTSQFSLENNRVHVALWRQKTRLRIYLNDEKAWDIPRAFGTAQYNAISFNTSGKEEEHFFVSNLRLAHAGEDTRHPLLETGRFETSDILFDVNKTTIKPSSFKILNDLGKVLQDNPKVNIRIIGHTDSDGNALENQQLSKKRAQAIKEYLSNNFPLAGKRMQILGKGESEPIANNTSPEGKAKNRRVEFVKI